MAYYDFDRIISEFLQDPGKATELRWERGKGSIIWQSSQHPDGGESGRKDRIVIKEIKGLPVIHHNGGTGESLDFWAYFKRLYSTNNVNNAAERLAEIYGIEPDYSALTQEQMEIRRKHKANADLLNLSAAYLTDVLKNSPKAEATREYLKSRKMDVSDRLAAFSSEIRQEVRAYLLKKAGGNASDIDTFLYNAFPFRNADDYRLLIPYYNGTTKKCTGFVGRLTSAEADMPKYINSRSEIFIKGGYCTRMDAEKPVVIVEGQMDAERLKQEGLETEYNIFCFGTQAPTGTGEQDAEHSQIATLQRYGVREIIYVPDYEFEADGTLRTRATQRTISAIAPFIDGRVNGGGFLSLSIAELYNRESGSKKKQDADSFVKEFGIAQFRGVLDGAKPFYEWELQQAVKSANGRDLAAKATDIYCSIKSDIDRELLKQTLTTGDAPYIQALRHAGFTTRYLNGIDRKGATASYRDAIKEAVKKLADAVSREASPETIGGLLKEAHGVQHRSNDAGFDAQMQATFRQIEQKQRNTPDPLRTDWQLYRYDREKGKDVEVRKIEFYANEVSFIAAPTSHGKTRVLIQMAVNFIKENHKHILYLSLEQDMAKLHELALKAYIGEKWNGTQCPTKSLRDSVRGQDLPEDLFYEATGQGLDLIAERTNYGKDIFPYLHFVKSCHDIETICNNIRGQVEEWQDLGMDADCIILDHMQLIDASGRDYSRTNELKGICNELNDLAKECGLPVIVASQFNRQAISPQGGGFEDIDTHNIAESANIENIASDIYMCFNTDFLPDSILSTKKESAQDYFNDGKKRTARCVYFSNRIRIKSHRMYVECLKGRYSGKGDYCLLPFRPDTGYVAMSEKATDYREGKDNF